MVDGNVGSKAKIKRRYCMPTAATIRLQIEANLAHRIPSALTPAPRVIRPVLPTGVAEIDTLLDGGLPVGAITEMVGRESSGRTAIALSFLRQISCAGRVCAWIDVSNALSPESAAAAGIHLSHLLWVRCGVSRTAVRAATPYSFSLPEKYMIPALAKKGLHGGGCGGHPRNEIKGMSDAVGGLLRTEALSPRCAEPQPRVRAEREVFAPAPPRGLQTSTHVSSAKPWARIEQALRATDLLLQAGGFSAIVLDMGSIAPDQASRVPLATWFRYRAAAERTHTSFLLLTQHPCTKSSSELLLKFESHEARHDEATVFTGVQHRMHAVRRRFAPASQQVIPMRKPPQRADVAEWKSHACWAGMR